MITSLYGNIDEVKGNVARLRQAPLKGELPLDARVQAEIAAHGAHFQEAVKHLEQQRTPQGEATCKGNTAFISGIACSDAAKELLADLFIATAPVERGHSR